MPDKMIITKNKLDALATSISLKSGVAAPMTIAQMKTAVDNISTTGPTPTGTKQINITMNGVITENVSDYANVEITTIIGGAWSEQTVTESGAVQCLLQPNVFYHFTSTALTSLSLVFSGTGTNEQYHFDFISPATPVTLTLPSSVIMENSFTVEANTKYEIDISNNEGIFAEWTYQEEND